MFDVISTSGDVSKAITPILRKHNADYEIGCDPLNHTVNVIIHTALTQPVLKKIEEKCQEVINKKRAFIGTVCIIGRTRQYSHIAELKKEEEAEE